MDRIAHIRLHLLLRMFPKLLLRSVYVCITFSRRSSAARTLICNVHPFAAATALAEQTVCTTQATRVGPFDAARHDMHSPLELAALFRYDHLSLLCLMFLMLTRTGSCIEQNTRQPFETIVAEWRRWWRGRHVAARGPAEVFPFTHRQAR